MSAKIIHVDISAMLAVNEQEAVELVKFTVVEFPPLLDYCIGLRNFHADTAVCISSVFARYM